MKKILSLLLFGFVLIITMNSDSYALATYVGIEIINLTDDSAHSCAGEAGYGDAGRIRALSSILPDYPIYFNLTKTDGTGVWDGNITKDCVGDGSGCDYAVGDIIRIPDTVNLIDGEDYKLFVDIDAIRIYLPLVDHNGFTATDDDNYWTVGKKGTDGEYYLRSDSGCSFSTTTGAAYPNLFFISSSRNNDYLTCPVNSNPYDCQNSNMMAIKRDSSVDDFNIDNLYDNLHTSSVGNFEFIFTFTE